MNNTEEFDSQLRWALDRICVWGWSEDPHVRYEAKIQAKTALEELTDRGSKTYECESCGASTYEDGPCHECGAKPFDHE